MPSDPYHPAYLGQSRDLPPRGERRRLDVYLGTALVGRLERRGPSRLRFEYGDDARRAHVEGAPLLSVSLPLRAAPFSTGEARPFFEGLLPEGGLRGGIARILGLSGGNAFGLLEALGADCAGAVVLLPRDAPPPSGQPHSVRWLRADDLERLIADLPRAPLGLAADVRLSLAGLQQKLVLVQGETGEWGQPLLGTPSTHIVKPQPDAFPGLVANELFCLRVAKRVGIAAACAWRERLGGHDCLVVERFDRERRDDGSVARLHQEDLCQALGVLPEAKYEAEGGPSVRATVELIRAVAGSRVAGEILAFLDQVVVGFVLGDGDRHGKNVGLLHDAPGSVRLAPAYDLVSTAVYPELTRRLAMAIGGEDDPDRIDRDAWSRLAAECGLGSGLPKRVAALAVRVVGAVRSVRAEAEDEGWAEPVLDEILAIAETRAATVA